MARTIAYYYSLNSPWTYLGGVRLEETARRHGATIDHKPVSLQEVFPVSGGLPLGKRAPQRQAYRLAELARWRDFLGMPLNLQPQYFPAAEWPAAGMVIAAQKGDHDCGRLTNAILKAVWVEERNIADTGTLRTIAGEIGMDGDALLEAAESAPVAAEYEANTAEAIERGVFGAPTYVFDDQMFWGQDRLDFLDRALAGA